MDSIFNVSLLTPIGLQKGTITFVEQNGGLSGSIRTMGSTNLFRNGKMNGHSFEFSGILNLGFFNPKYIAKGTIDGNTLKAVATTDFGTFQINGTRAE